MFCRNCGKELIGTPEICMGCGARPTAGNSFCTACGAATNPLAEICIKCGARVSGTTSTARASEAKSTTRVLSGDESPKSRLVTTLLAFFIGVLGAHRFYVGKYGTAIVMLIVFIVGIILNAIHIGPTGPLGAACTAAIGIWAFIDFIFAVLGKFKDVNSRVISDWGVG